MVVNNLQQIFG